MTYFDILNFQKPKPLKPKPNAQPMDFINDLDPIVQAFWYIALPTTLIFLIQTIMTFTGSDAADGLSADFQSDVMESGGPFQLFSFRNLINFLLGFSWTGIGLSTTIENPIFLTLASFVSGILFVSIFFFAMGQIQKLAEDNTFQLSNCLGKNGSVYLTIPANRSGKGKIQVSVNGAFHEIEAITPYEGIPSGLEVRVTKIVNESLVEVEKNTL